MKNNNQIKVSFLLVVFGIATLIGTSSFRSIKTDGGDSVKTFATDEQFLIHAAESNLQQIQLGQLAQTKSSLKDVKELGSMMEKKHKQALTDLYTLANKKGVVLPTSVTSDAKDKYQELSNDSEKEFNDSYCELMVDRNREAIAMFEKISTDSKDADVREWASAAIPSLNTNLKQAEMCKEMQDKNN